MGYVRQATWPGVHSTLFSHIQALGDTEDTQYTADVTLDLIEKPWRAETKYRARELAAHARKLSNEARNESGWRLWLEAFVLYRFTVEVTW